MEGAPKLGLKIVLAVPLCTLITLQVRAWYLVALRKLLQVGWGDNPVNKQVTVSGSLECSVHCGVSVAG